jgi:hypothetical protein
MPQNTRRYANDEYTVGHIGEKYILRWAMTLQLSAWIHPTVMADSTFHFLIGDLKAIFDQISLKVTESLHCLKDEEPLKPCEQFQEFVKSIDRSNIGELQKSMAG